ncbi:MAG: hypothetical protein WC858_02885 [Parcubacteria group bacterium]
MKPEIDADQFQQLVVEGTEQVSSWLMKESISQKNPDYGKLIGSFIRIYLSNRKLVASSARQPGGQAGLIYQAIYSKLNPTKQRKPKIAEDPFSQKL